MPKSNLKTKAAAPSKVSAGKRKQHAPKRQEHEAQSAREPTAVAPARKPPRSQTKQALVIGLLQGEGGATLDDLVTATGWLPHTTRAALTRLRQSEFMVEKSKDEGGRTVYHTAAAPPAVPPRKVA